MNLFPGRDVFVFDLDNTLYPADHAIFLAIGDRMTAYVQRVTGAPRDEAMALQERYYHLYGATVVGMQRHHGVDPAAFMADVHAVSFDAVLPDPDLAALIGALPGRRIVFSNGARAYAHAIVDHLGLGGVFERIVALEDVDWIPKPEPAAFTQMAALCGFSPARAVMFEDHPRNLAAAKALGFATVLVGPNATPSDTADYAAASLHAFLRDAVTGPATTGAALTGVGTAPSQQA
ncbi:MAG: pyrimidine 5'-nucleotidase [Hyphomonadaceae bacterium]|nr:pyrimidine 5'-nucleotidase [Hyphomonadaceae bacterium]